VPEEESKSSDRRAPRRIALVLILAAAGYGAFLSRYAAFAVGGSDSSGYANTARRLAAGSLLDRPRCLDRLGLPDALTPVFTPLGFLPGPRPGTTAPLYPIGFPAHLAIAAEFAGWDVGPFLVSPVAAAACLLLLYLVGRELALSRLWSAAAAVILAIFPPFLFQALQPMSDVVATFWCLVAVFSALKARRRPAWALAAGASLGAAVLVRPTNAVMAVPLFFALPFSATTWLRVMAGGLPLAAVGAAVNVHCYGGILKTGYEKTGHQAYLALTNFGPRFLYYGAWIVKTLSPVVPLAAVTAAALRRIPARDRALVLSWFGVYFIFYCFYEPYRSLIFLRFLLPGFPGLFLAAALTAQEWTIGKKWRRLRGAAAIVATLLVLGLEVRGNREVGVLGVAEGESIYPRVSRWASRMLPAKSVVVTTYASGALEYYTELCYTRWDSLQPETFARIRQAAEARGYRFFALLYPDEETELSKHAPGRWRRTGSLRQVGIWQLDP
jgi:dolichyl-phosphate-mannose-protein mannosyltransferase